MKFISLRKLCVPTSPNEKKCVRFAISLRSSLNVSMHKSEEERGISPHICGGEQEPPGLLKN